jgi:hypothetical protein
MEEILMSVEEAVAEAARAASAALQVPAIVEDKGNVVKELAERIAKQSFAVVVGAAEFTPVAQSAETVVGNVLIVVSLFERPVVNRTRKGAPCLFPSALRTAKALTYLPAGSARLFLRRITRVQEHDGGVIGCDVEFTAKVVL